MLSGCYVRKEWPAASFQTVLVVLVRVLVAFVNSVSSSSQPRASSSAGRLWTVLDPGWTVLDDVPYGTLACTAQYEYRTSTVLLFKIG